MYRASRAQHSIPEQQHYVCDICGGGGGGDGGAAGEMDQDGGGAAEEMDRDETDDDGGGGDCGSRIGGEGGEFSEAKWAALSRNKRRNWLRLPKPDGYAQMTKTQQRNWRVKQ